MNFFISITDAFTCKFTRKSLDFMAINRFFDVKLKVYKNFIVLN